MSDMESAVAGMQEGLSNVAAGTDPVWAEYAWQFLLAYCRDNDTLFVDDLWDSGLAATRELRALGPLFLKASRTGFIVKSGRYQKSVRSHLGMKAIWNVKKELIPHERMQ